MPAERHCYVQGFSELNHEGILTLRLATGSPRRTPEAPGPSTQPPSRAPMPEHEASLQVPDPRQIKSGVIPAATTKQDRTLRQLQSHLAYIQRRNGSETGLCGGWNQNAQEQLDAWLLQDTKGLKRLALEDRKQEAKAEPKPPAQAMPCLKEEPSHETENVEEEGKIAKRDVKEDGRSEDEGAQHDVHENMNADNMGETHASASSSSSSSSSSSTCSSEPAVKRRRIKKAMSLIQSVIIVCTGDVAGHNVATCEDCTRSLQEALASLQQLL